MITHKLSKLPKNTYALSVTIPWKDIQNEYKAAFDLILAQFELKGYRKGKVPSVLAEKHIAKDAVYQQLIRSFLPRVYEEVITKEKLNPIISPRIDLKKAKEDEDWEVEFKVAERPTVDLKNYKEAIKKAKAKQKPDPAHAGKEESKENHLNTVLDALMKEASCEISDLLIEEEVQQRLTKLVDDIQRLGLTTETYLKSKNLTMDGLKEQFTKETMDAYKIEFVLMAVAEAEKIAVDQADMEKLLGSIKDEKDRAAAQQNAYFYASVLRKQKTLDFLTSL